MLLNFYYNFRDSTMYNILIYFDILLNKYSSVLFNGHVSLLINILYIIICSNVYIIY